MSAIPHNNPVSGIILSAQVHTTLKLMSCLGPKQVFFSLCDTAPSPRYNCLFRGLTLPTEDRSGFLTLLQSQSSQRPGNAPFPLLPHLFILTSIYYLFCARDCEEVEEISTSPSSACELQKSRVK